MPPIQRKPMTPYGFQKLKSALRELKEVRRPANVRAIEEARAHGDLSENAEYKYAKEEQGHIAREIRETEDMLARAQVIDPGSLSGERVVFGATVTLMDLDTDEEITYTIVGQPEADVSKGRISIESPIARGLIGKVSGDEVVIQTPKGDREFEVAEVSFHSVDDWD